MTATVAFLGHVTQSRRVRRALLTLVVVPLLLAGCADDPPPVEPGEPTFSDGEVPLGAPLAPMTWMEVHNASFTAAPAAPYQAPVTVPLGTLTVVVNFTLDAGGTTGISIVLGECHWARDVPLVMGQSFGADCGGLSPAQDMLDVQVPAGAIAGTLTVAALTCDKNVGRCPAPAPVSKS